MPNEQKLGQWLYRKLLRLYPREFKERLGESMQQTFDDLYKEQKRQAESGVFGFLLWIFLETAIGILREHVLLIMEGNIMQNLFRTIGASALLGLILILPFAIMEIVNRQRFNEDFPFVLFFALWLNLFALCLILLPIMRSSRLATRDPATFIPAKGNTLLSNPWFVAVISVALILSPGILPLLDSLGWLSLDRLVNGPNPEVAYPPGQFITVGLILFPVAGARIAGGPIVRTLRAGGSLFAHPFHLFIVAVISFLFAAGFASLLIDQWPCFIGVPNCD